MWADKNSQAIIEIYFQEQLSVTDALVDPFMSARTI